MHLETALAAAKLGGKILLENLNSEKRNQIDNKQEFDFVTQVDYLSEQTLIKFIQDRHPGHAILAEETGGRQTESDYLWIIDPLDGTKNYIHGFPQFSVSVALQFKNEIITGAVYDPLRDEMFHAVKGSGAYLNGEKIHVSTTSDFSRCLVATGFPFKNKHITDAYFEAFIAIFHKISDMRRAGSAALDLAYVASGRLDAYWEIGISIWDIAAGVLLVTEAGGEITDFFGTKNIAGGNLVASNQLIHENIVKKTRRVFQDIHSF